MSARFIRRSAVSSASFLRPSVLPRTGAIRLPITSNWSPISNPRRNASGYSFLPTILQPSFWRDNIIPKSLKSPAAAGPETDSAMPKSKEWNPATFFIVIFLLIGSQAIQTIALQRSYAQFSQHTEAKLALLREVMKRVQAGEDVDVEAMLGKGDQKKEKEWEDVMRELEEEDAMIQSRNQRRRAKQAARALEAAAAEEAARQAELEQKK